MSFFVRWVMGEGGQCPSLLADCNPIGLHPIFTEGMIGMEPGIAYPTLPLDFPSKAKKAGHKMWPAFSPLKMR